MIQRLDDLRTHVDDLAEVLHATVHDGASVGFVMPFPLQEARDFWLGVQAGVASGQRILFAAFASGRVVGTIQIVAGGMPNGSHRAEIAKLLVHPEARRRGLARRLLHTAEEAALADGKTLLVLDTRQGDPASDLYLSAGYTVAGVIPDYAQDPAGGPRLDPTVYMYKRLVRG